MAAAEGAGSQVKSAVRTVELLEFFAGRPGMHSLAAVQESVGYPKSSLYMLLRTLVDLGWIETDATGTFTVQEFECLGACDRAPIVMINNEHWQEHQRPEDVPRFLEDLRTRGLAALSGCHLVPAGEREPRR